MRGLAGVALLLLGCGAAAAAQDAEALAAAWCARTSATPEPHVIFYNKLGKCGSTTMDNTAQRYARETPKRAFLGLAPSQWKDNLKRNPAARAKMLRDLGGAYGDLGDHAKARDVLERALAIDERAYGRDHPNVARTLNNLGNAYGDLGDQAKKRDMLERALAINERAYGRDHTAVATTLGNLGNAYGDLGDPAKKRDMLERALAIKEREYVRQKAAGGASVFVTGHVYFDPEFEGFGTSFGRFQLLRSCAPRSYSKLVYTHKDLDAGCLRNVSCARGAYGGMLRSMKNTALKFLGGSENATIEASIDHLRDYAVWGFIDRFGDTLDLLACAFPSFFSPVLHEPRQRPPHRNACTGINCAPDPAVLDYIDAELCDAENEVLAVARALFDAISRRVAAGEKCCRPPRNASARELAEEPAGLAAPRGRRRPLPGDGASFKPP